MNVYDFMKPDIKNKMASFWSWNDKLSAQELKRQIGEMADKGWGGFFMHARVGLETGYLSDEWMEMIKVCAKEAKEKGIQAWLYDEDRWPSGYAGGKVPLKNPDYRGQMLILLSESEVSKDDVPMRDIHINGEKKVICKRTLSLGNDWFNGTCYIDTMNPEAVKYFIDCTHEKYKKECGEYFGDSIVGIFTDEPCYIRRTGIHEPTVPWTEKLPDFFFAQKGYRIEEHLAELFFDIADYQHIRFDYYDCVSRLFLDGYTSQYFDWCKQNGIKMTGHLVAEDTMVAQTGRVGSVMPHYEYMHWPGIDKLERNISQPVTIKQLSSVVEQLGKERALCEAFGCIGQQASFFHRKWIADWMAALGINHMCLHLSLYSMRGERKRDYPPNFFFQQPWWESENSFADYVARLCYFASEGKREADILIIQPITSVWCEYSPIHRDNNFAKERNEYDKPFARLTDELIANKLDFHYGNELIMGKYASIKGEKLVIGQHEYSTVIVPPSLTINGKTLQLLEEFSKKSGNDGLIFIQPYPVRVDGKKQTIPWIGEAVVIDDISQAVSRLDKIYHDRIRVVDCLTKQNADKIICQQRSSEKGKCIFIANTDEVNEVDVIVTLPGIDKPLMLDLFSGKVYEAPLVHENTTTQIKLKFYPAGSLLFFYPTSQEIDVVESAPAVLASGVSFGEINSANKLEIDDWRVVIPEYNVLPLDRITLYIEGEKVLEDQHISKVWDLFQQIHDDRCFCAEYTFEIRNIPDEPMFAVIEQAEEYKRVFLNGSRIFPLKEMKDKNVFDSEKCWKDISFVKVPLGGFVQEGVNKLSLYWSKTIKSMPLNRSIKEIETVYLTGNFEVENDSGIRDVAATNKIIDHRNLTDSGYPFYAGKVLFIKRFTVEREFIGRVYLRIHDVKAACIELYLNDVYVDVRYWSPYVFDITKLIKSGINEIKIVAATTLFNLLGPNWNKDIMSIERVTPKTFRDSSKYTEEYIFEPFGIGRAELVSI